MERVVAASPAKFKYVIRDGAQADISMHFKGHPQEHFMDEMLLASCSEFKLQLGIRLNRRQPSEPFAKRWGRVDWLAGKGFKKS
jgi:hypothetical protein